MAADLKQFHDSVKKGDIEAVAALLAESPSLLNETNEAGQSATLLARYYRQDLLADFLLTQEPKLDLYSAVAVGKLNVVRDELRRDPALIGKHSPDGWTPLHLAAFFGQLEAADLLVRHGAEVEATSTNAMKTAPLHAAAAGRQRDLIAFLLGAGAQINRPQEGGWTALHAAAQNGDRAIAELLIIHGADVTARAENGQTPLDLALLGGHKDVADLLYELSKEPPPPNPALRQGRN